jgi:cytidylate kinase
MEFFLIYFACCTFLLNWRIVVEREQHTQKIQELEQINKNLASDLATTKEYALILDQRIVRYMQRNERKIELFSHIADPKKARRAIRHPQKAYAATTNGYTHDGEYVCVVVTSSARHVLAGMINALIVNIDEMDETPTAAD